VEILPAMTLQGSQKSCAEGLALKALPATTSQRSQKLAPKAQR
jgi:hypothetical protein